MTGVFELLRVFWLLLAPLRGVIQIDQKIRYLNNVRAQVAIVN